MIMRCCGISACVMLALIPVCSGQTGDGEIDLARRCIQYAESNGCFGVEYGNQFGFSVRDGAFYISDWRIACPSPMLANLPPYDPTRWAYPTPEVTAPLIAGTNQLGTASLYVDAQTMAVFAVTNSASPRRTASQQAAERAARKAATQAIATRARAAKSAAAAANSVPALRQQVAELAELVRVLTEGGAE